MPQLPEGFVRDLVSKTSLMRLVNEHVPLKKAGSRYVGLCPFHDEKTPSFGVNEAMGFFHCFGCGKSGDAVTFLREHIGLSFMEAVRYLADALGIPLPEASQQTPQQRRQAQQRKERRTLLAEANEAAAEYFRESFVRASPASVVREYATERGLTEETQRTFSLGFAPEAWDGMVKALIAKGIPLEAAAEVGLVVPKKSGRGHYDRFRNRLMFPVRDATGRVVAFGGRALPEPEPEAPVDDEERRKPAKYINSPESPVYTKGDTLFGLYEARSAIRERKRAIVVEGNIDLLILHQGGFGEAIAPMGTALTEKQLRLASRFAPRLVLMYDGDRAGRAATAKAVELALGEGIGASVVLLPDGDDPDSFLRREGASALREAIDRAIPGLDHLLDEMRAENGLTEEGKARSLSRLAPLVSRIRDRRQRDLTTARIASALSLDDFRVARLLAAGSGRESSPPRASAGHDGRGWSKGGKSGQWAPKRGRGDDRESGRRRGERGHSGQKEWRSGDRNDRHRSGRGSRDHGGSGGGRRDFGGQRDSANRQAFASSRAAGSSRPFEEGPHGGRSEGPRGPSSRAPMREREMVEWCLHHPGCLELVEAADGAELLEHEQLRQVLWEAIVLHGEAGRIDAPLLLERLEGNPLKSWAAERLCSETRFDSEAAIEHVQNALGWLKQRHAKQQVQDLQWRMAQADRVGDKELAEALAREYIAQQREMVAIDTDPQDEPRPSSASGPARALETLTTGRTSDAHTEGETGSKVIHDPDHSR